MTRTWRMMLAFLVGATAAHAGEPMRVTEITALKGEPTVVVGAQTPLQPFQTLSNADVLRNLSVFAVEVYFDARYAPLVMGPGEEVAMADFVEEPDAAPSFLDRVYELALAVTAASENKLETRDVAELSAPILEGDPLPLMSADGGALDLVIAGGVPPYVISLDSGGQELVSVRSEASRARLTAPPIQDPLVALTLRDADDGVREYMLFAVPAPTQAASADAEGALIAALEALNTLKSDSGASRLSALAHLRAAAPHSAAAATLAADLESGAMDWRQLLD